MPYEITATRKRPQNFEEFKGQEFVSATLESSLASGRIAHAYLFSGPRGCGKTSAARILAKALNCEQGPTAKPCGTCRSCIEIARGASLDVIEIDGASNTSVDNVRQIKDEVLFPPNGGHYKVYIIDEVHMLSNSAFNALLKTIEEPPPYIVFIFATTELHKVPATIKSRCQQFAFRLFKVELVQSLLAEAAAELGVEAEEEALLWIAKESGGSLRDAYTLFDQVVSFSEGRLSAALIRDKLGLVGLDALNGMFGSCVAGEAGAALDALDGILARGVSAEQCVVDSVEYFRSLLLIKHGILKPSLLGAPPSAYDPKVLEALSSERIERALAGLLDLYRDIRFSVDPRFELELAVSRICRLVDYISPGELAKTVAALRRHIAGEGSVPSQASKAETKASVVSRGEPIASVAENEKKKSELPVGLRNAFGSLGAAVDEKSAKGDAAKTSPALPVAVKAAASISAPPRPVPQAPSVHPVSIVQETLPRNAAFVPPTSFSPSPDEPDEDDEPVEEAVWISGDAAQETKGVAAAAPVAQAISLSKAMEPESKGSEGFSNVETLRLAVIEALGRSSPLLKTGLSASLPWRIDESRLVIPFRSGMEESVVRSSLADIAVKAGELAGRSLKVELRIESPGRSDPRGEASSSAGGSVSDAQAAPGMASVAVVERVFRGARVEQRAPSQIAPASRQGGLDELR